MSSIKCLGFSTQVHVRGANLVWLSQSSRNFKQEKRSTRLIMSSINALTFHDKCTHKVQARYGSNFLPLTEKASCVLLPVSQWKPWTEQEPFAPNWSASSVLAYISVIYSRAGFGQRLLACLNSESICTNSFCPNRSRLPEEGPSCRNFVTPQVTMGQFGQIFVPHRKLQNLCRFR